MTVNDLIRKHQLKEVPNTPTPRKPKPIPSTMLPDENIDYTVYSNDDKTIWVTLDRKRNLFKIMYAEIAISESEWLDASIDRVVDL